MNKDDMILISVDDHIVEPPDMFKNHLPKKYLDEAPRLVHNPDGVDTWQFRDVVIPNVALNAVAGRPKEEYGLEPQGLDEIRPGLLAGRRAGQGHERRRHPGVDVLPVVPGLRGPAVRHRGPGVLAGAGAGLQRLARRGVVRGVPGAVHSDDAAGDLGCRSVRQGGAAQRRAWRAFVDVHREPGRDGLSVLPRRLLDAVVGGAGRHRHGDERAHRLVGPAGDHRPGCADGRDDHAAADEHRAGRRGSVVVRADQEVPGSQDRAVGGRHRLDPVLPRARGPHL